MDVKRDAPSEADEVLVVDDVDMIQTLLSKQLERRGLKCHLAGNHSNALRILEDNDQIRYVFLDFEIPGEDTPKFIRKLSSSHPKLKIIGISGRPLEDSFASSGVARFLQKPWKMGDLDRVLH